MEEKKPGFDWSLFQALLAAWPYRVEGQWFYRQTVVLDGYHFVRCRFDSCTLKTTKATFVLENCVLSQSNIVYQGEAWKAVRLYNLIAPEAQKEALARWPTLAPTIHEDYTISIR